MAPSAFRKQQDEKRKTETRKLLLEAATRVFAGKGYHKTLISEIVAEAGVGQGTFYRHFHNKREIFETLLEGFTTQLFDQFAEMSAHLPASKEEYREASLKALHRVAGLVEQNRRLCLVILREAATVDEEISDSVAAVYNRLSQLAQYYLDDAIANGFARPCRSEVVARAIVGMGVHMTEAWLTGHHYELATKDLVTEIVNFSFLGLQG